LFKIVNQDIIQIVLKGKVCFLDRQKLNRHHGVQVVFKFCQDERLG
jgi:hypothetical protein